MPDRPPNTTDLTAIQLLDAVPGLRLADRDWRALASMRHPVKVALWLALLRPSEELLDRESLVESVRPQNAGASSDSPTTQVSEVSDPPTRSRPERRSIPAVVAWAEAAVRKGINGDMQAWALVADRIEGKAGLRKDDVDPEDERRRGDIQSTIEAVVRAMVNNRLAQPGDDSLEVEAIVTDERQLSSESSMDSERQDRDTARRNEIAGAARREAQDSQERGESLVETNQEPEERDLTDPIRGPQITRRTNGHG